MSHVVSALQCLLTDWFLSSASPHHHQPPPARLLCGDQEAGSCELDRYSWADTGHTSRYLVCCGDLISISRYQRSYIPRLAAAGLSWARLGVTSSVECKFSLPPGPAPGPGLRSAQQGRTHTFVALTRSWLHQVCISVSINNHDIIILDIYSFFVFTCMFLLGGRILTLVYSMFKIWL